METKSEMELLDLGLQKIEKGKEPEDSEETESDWVSENSEGVEIWSKLYPSNYIAHIEPSENQYLCVLAQFIPTQQTPLVRKIITHSDIAICRRNLDRLAYLATKSVVAKILASVSDLFETQNFLKEWSNQSSKAKPDPEGFELELEGFSGDFEEIADLIGMELPYYYSFDHGSWMQNQQRGPVTEATPVPMDEIINEVEAALRSRLSAIKNELFEKYNLSPEIDIEGRGTAADPFYLVLRYTEADAALLQTNQNAA